MNAANAKLKDAVDEVDRLMQFLTDHTKSDIDTQAVEFDVDREFKPDSAFSSEEIAEQVRDLREDSLKAAGIAKNIPDLIEACAELVMKHPREAKHLADILRRMHVEVHK